MDIYNMDDLICKKYRLIEKLGEGCFGSVYKAESIRTKVLVAIKVEKKGQYGLLKNETNIYRYLNSFDKCVGIPKLYWFGVDETHNYMAVELLGKNINEGVGSQDILKKMLDVVEFIHSKGLIHRDIKTDNFLYDESRRNIYLIDYGFCKRYKVNGKHIEKRMDREKNMIGTPNYVSIRVLEGEEGSRRDDLESLVYIMYFLWKKKVDIEDKYLLLKKEEGIPKNILLFFEYCRELGFDEDPNYKYLFSLVL